MGGSSQGTTTTVTNNTPFNSSQLLDYQNKAVDLSNTDPLQYYPGQTYALPSGYQTAGYNNAGNAMLGAGDALSPYLPGAQTAALNNDAWLANGGAIATAQPWFNALSSVASNNPAAVSIQNLLGLTNGTAVQDLAATANGDYLNANPYLDNMYGAASDAVTRAYQTATAPTTDSQMEAAGRYGSGALSGAQSVNQANLGQSLDNLASNIYGQNYANERQLMNNAAGTLGGLQTTMLTNAGQLGVQGQNSQIAGLNAALSNLNNYFTGQQNAINATPTLGNMVNTDYQAAINAGQGQQQLDQAQINDLIARFYGTQQAPWQTLQQEAGIIGSAIPGMSSTTSPYFQPSPFSQILGGAAQGASLAKAFIK